MQGPTKQHGLVLIAKCLYKQKDLAAFLKDVQAWDLMSLKREGFLET